MKKILIYILLVFSPYTVCMAQNYLFNNGRTDYTIVVGNNASQSEKTAAKELQLYLKAISGVTLPLKANASGKSIYVGWRTACGDSKPAASSEAYTYKTIGNDLYIYGGSTRGTMYGVYSFLENELGVRWYTTDYTKVPHISSFKLGNINHSEAPAIKRRLDFYYPALITPTWCAHNKQNESFQVFDNQYGGLSSYYGAHTFFDLVPTNTYFSSHPEYYSLYNGKRISDGQLCLSNASVRKILTAALLKRIAQNPGYWVYDVSQMDNQKYCQCARCTALTKRYGGQSGLILWFVNQVADEVKKAYPDKKIGTFAYLYSRHAPQNIKARENVVVRLCSAECCFAHPFNSSCSLNKSFMDDLKAWKNIASNIYIWDYVVDFYMYLAPFPNFNVLADNIKTMASSNVIGVMEEAVHEAPWGEFSELRQWILAKLLWNPNTDTQKLAEEFITDYYGKAASDVLTYYNMEQGLVNEQTHLFYNTLPRADIYTESFITQSTKLLEGALKKVRGDKTMEKRVSRVLAQVYFLHLARSTAKAKADGTYAKLAAILKADNTNVKESIEGLDATLEYLKDL